MWKRLDIDKSQQYQVALIQSPNGSRGYALVLVGAASLPEHTAFVTGVVPHDLLWWGRVGEIGRTVKLTNGEPFFTDPHNVWLTQQEATAFEGYLREERPWQSIPWLNGLPPDFPPC